MKGFLLATGAVLLTLTLAAPSDATLNACASAKTACVAKKTAALLKCHTKNEKPPGMDPAKLADCVQKAQDKFDGGTDPSQSCFAKLEAKYGAACATDDDTDDLEATVDAFVDEVACRLDLGTCTHCSDGIQNGSETDVDCGGSCTECGFTQTCEVPADCVATTTCFPGLDRCYCSAGRNDCNFDLADACETETTNDPANCGSCGNVCSSTNGASSCVNSQCVMDCNTGFGDCDGKDYTGCETNTGDDIYNCGSCGHFCPWPNGAMPICSASQCDFTCYTGYGDCDADPLNGCEAKLLNDSLNCGVCGNACFGGQQCINGSCS